MLKGAIFDIDGTLIDSVDAHAESWSKAFAEHGYTVSAAQARGQIGKGADNLLPVFLDEAAIARDGEALEKAHDRVFHEQYIQSVRPFPMVRELFQALHDRGVRLALASSSTAADIEHYKTVLGIENLLDTASSSEDVENTKPAPDIFQVAMDRLLPLDHERTLAFGDTPWDAQAAARVGLRTIGLRCGGFPDDELEKAGTLRLFDDPAALLAGLDDLLALV